MKIIPGILAVLVVFLCSGFARAEQEEITLTTYYPAPYGEYDSITSNTLTADTLAIGLEDSESEDSGIIKLKVLDDLQNQPYGEEGHIYYSGKDKQLMTYDGSGWKAARGQNTGYDMSKVKVYNHQENGVTNVTLVDISGSGVLLGGSVVGALFKSIAVPGGSGGMYRIDMLVDGRTYTLPMKSDGTAGVAFCEIEGGGNDDFCSISLPSPIKFDSRLRIRYSTINSGDLVTGTAYVYQD
jgi:hypothetical protein